jgi:hypothetical protein
VKRIIILEKQSDQNTSFRYLLWATVPEDRRPFYAGGTTSFTKASQSEKDLFASGELVEKSDTITVADYLALSKEAVVKEPPKEGVVAKSVGELSAINSKATLVNTMMDLLMGRWKSYQTEVNNHNPWVSYGTYWDDDGTGWVEDGIK